MHATNDQERAPPTSNRKTTCRHAQMSRWRQKGFVQDSDDDEEESQLESQSTGKIAVSERRIERDENVAGRWEENEEHAKSPQKHHVVENQSGDALDGLRVRGGSNTPPRRTSLQRPTPSPFTPFDAHEAIRGLSESPDPLQRTPTPKAQRRRTPISSQLLGSPGLQPNVVPVDARFQSSGVASAPRLSPVTTPERLATMDHIGRASDATHILGEFGIDPLSEGSDDDDLSDVPSDLESPSENAIFSRTQPSDRSGFAPPHRRTAVQVVIPSSTVLQRHLEERASRREFRQRKPIQLHPYALEGEMYRREVQSRGLRPVARARSAERPPEPRAVETQEEDFDPDATPSSSPLETEIPVSTPVVQRPKTSAKDVSDQAHALNTMPRLASTQLHRPREFKRSRLNLPSTHIARSPAEMSQAPYQQRSIWSVPPNSPPYSSSPMLPNGDSSIHPKTLHIITPAGNLPTPSTSSVLQDDLGPQPDTDVDVIQSSARLSSRDLRRPTRVILSDDPSSASDTPSESEPYDNELKKVRRKIKGVLPASWLRFDKQTQERRKAQERIQMRRNATFSPEPTEHQRGVAQRVARPVGRPPMVSGADTPSRNIVLISDESNYESHDPVFQRIVDKKDSAGATTALARLFDRRYDDDDLSDMENDRLHLPTLGGSGPKRKRQTKLTDPFRIQGGQKSTVGSHRIVKDGERLSGTRPRKRRRKDNQHHTPTPAMSIVDFDTSPSKNCGGTPLFIRLAKRQALRRPDLARQSPQTKQIRLSNLHDTEDANQALYNWRSGVLKRKAGLVSRRKEERQPLANKIDNQQVSRRPSLASQRGDGNMVDLSATAPKESHSRPRNNLLPGLGIFRRASSQQSHPLRHNAKIAKARRKLEATTHTGLAPFKPAQLEGDENVFSRSHRRIAFEQGLQRAARQYGLPTAMESSHMNLQVARFLADDESILQPLPSTGSTKILEANNPTQKAPLITKRLTRKAPAQRIDVDMREFRQPSEPAIQEVLNVTSTTPILEVASLEGQSILQGLGPHGTRYPVSFDVHPFVAGTYFHSTTFIGSDAFRQALLAGTSESRSLDEPAGYCLITHGTLAARCGPWNDETSSHLCNIAQAITEPLNQQMTDSNPSFEVCSEILASMAGFVRAVIDYISTNLSFLDSIDREGFVEKMTQLSQEISDHVSTIFDASGGASAAIDVVRHSTRTRAYLLILSIQLYHVSQHSLVDPSNQVAIISFIKTISRTIVMHLVHKGIPELSSFLELNKRHKARECGVQESELLVESTILCMQGLESIAIPGSSFWDYTSLELCVVIANAKHVSSFETMWASIFTFLPFTEVDRCGIPIRNRRETFQADNWTCIRELLKAVFDSYPSTYKKHSTSLNDYVRTTLARCHRLVKYWHWERPELMLNAVMDFFGKNGLKQLRNEASNKSASFLDDLSSYQSLLLEPNEPAFHIALKCLALGLQGLRKVYAEKRIRSFVFRTIPNHGRAYPKDQTLDEQSLAALRNHHDLLIVLYWAAPPSCRPKLDRIRDLVNHENSHREACRLNVRAWANLAAFQLSTEEPYTSARPFALWHREMMHHTLKQYRLAKIEADDYIKSGVLDGTSDVSAVMVRQTMERNQEQVIATLRDCITGMRKAIQHGRQQSYLTTFLIESDLVHLLELPHLEDRRLVHVIRDVLILLRDYAVILEASLVQETSQTASDESQDYGDFPDMDDLDDHDSRPAVEKVEKSSLDFVQSPLWHLLSNAFGAETSPDDNLLMDCVDTWVCLARSQVKSGRRAWSYYLDPYSHVAWTQLRQTEQTRKFEPYYMAALVNYDMRVYEEHRQEFIQALLLSLTARESMLRFQHRLMATIAGTDDSHPLLQNLPFFREQETDTFDITADTLRARRLAILSSMLSNMRDDVRASSVSDATHVSEIRRSYAAMLKAFMTTIKFNYQQLQQGTAVTGAYVEFVQKIVQFLKQYTNDICPVLPFFTDSVAFPLPAADPTYVVARLCGYASKVRESGTTKSLSTFIQTVAQQAAVDNQQLYLVNQLVTALCTEEAPAADRVALQCVLLQGIFPAYLESAFSSSTTFLISRSILQALPSILATMIFDLRIMQPENVSKVLGSIIAVSHSLIRGTEKLMDNPYIFRQPHILSALSFGLDALAAILPIMEYISSQDNSTSNPTKPPIAAYMESFTICIAEALHDMIPTSIPSYDGYAHAASSDKQHADLLEFARQGLKESIKTNWSESYGDIWFGQGQARRVVVFNIGTVEDERARLIAAIEAFYGTVRSVFGDDRVCGGVSSEESLDLVI